MVKSGHERDNADTQLTGDNAVAGTPAFMAPEQVLGNRPIDGRTDLYAVGCVAYWLITGQHVFAGRTAMETMVQHAQSVPVAPSTRTEMDVPPALDHFILSRLAKNPDDRPDSADALAEALASIPTRDSWTTARAREWWDRHHPAHAANRAIEETEVQPR